MRARKGPSSFAAALVRDSGPDGDEQHLTHDQDVKATPAQLTRQSPFLGLSRPYSRRPAGEIRAAWELDVSVREYRDIEAGERSPSWETLRPDLKLFGWPQTFATKL